MIHQHRDNINYKNGGLIIHTTFDSKIQNFLETSFNEIILTAKTIFKETHVFKPQSSRKESKESFLVCKNLLTV